MPYYMQLIYLNMLEYDGQIEYVENGYYYGGRCGTLFWLTEKDSICYNKVIENRSAR
jgi:hypothetical protein